MIYRIFVEKKDNLQAKKIKSDLAAQLNIHAEDVREVIRYDVEGVTDEEFEQAIAGVFSEPPVDTVYREELPVGADYDVFAIAFLDGQYDQRADSAMQCVQLLSMRTRPLIKCATVYAFAGAGVGDMDKIKHYLINPVDSREGDMVLPETLVQVT